MNILMKTIEECLDGHGIDGGRKDEFKQACQELHDAISEKIINEKDIKDFIKANLILETDFKGSSNNMTVSLIFKGDKNPFSEDVIYIPEYED